MCSSISSTTVQSWRERPPSSYSLKIQSFSLLEKTTLSSDGNYQSHLFSSGGYNWRLIIYPKGNDNDKGSGFISMYVEIDSTSLMSRPPSEVYADLRFFVFNRNENKYFTIQDVESKRFNTIRRVWGLSQVLSLDLFNDPKKGYIFEGDKCEFGVDIIVAPPPTNWEVVTFKEKLLHPKFTWTLKNFSELKEDPHTSNSFSTGGKRWVLTLYPKGDTKADGKWLSIFLFLDDTETLREDEKIFAQAYVRVLDPFGNRHVTMELNDWHDKLNEGWGYSKFVSIAELLNAYLDKDGSLKVEIEFDFVSTIEHYPII